jgi:nitrate/TMAO reductase-like tetraheme cytochrome c subunit
VTPWLKWERRSVLRLFVQLTILGVILLAIGTVGFVEYSAKPGFCDNCHIMEPYYESWKTSSHHDVPCIECHYAPGIKAEAMGKFQAANQVVKYVTGAYGTKPWAEIDDAACLRSGCHVEAKLSTEIEFKGVLFSHAQHLGELRRGKQLRCTSCHSQIVQGAHVAVTEETCFLCHFKGRNAAEPIAGCVGCHPSPPRVQAASGVVIDHPQFVRNLVSCLSCHTQVTHGSGAADQARCFNCHNEPERLNQFANTTLLHRVHIAEHKVECTQCHTPIEHRVVALTTTDMGLDCGTCHQGVHAAQQRMLAGVGGHGTDSAPSAMYLARVSCKSCHELKRETRGHERVQVAGEAACMSCHGIKYANILPQWRQEIDRRLARATEAVGRVDRVRGAAPVRARQAVDSLLAQARDNLELVRVGRGAHNVGYADRLVRAAVALARQAARVGTLPVEIGAVDLGPALDQNACLQCHVGIERQTGTFQGAPFDHQRHVLDGGLACARCHTPLDQHGGITLASTGACDDCHHRAIEPMNCAQCHAGPGGAPEPVIANRTGDFSHGVHREIGLACGVCHVPPAMRATDLKCDACHAAHHLPADNCLACHRGGVKAKHPKAVAHGACSRCHGDKVAGLTKWSRQVCTVCHTDRVQHNAPVACDLCHEVPSIAAPGGGEET